MIFTIYRKKHRFYNVSVYFSSFIATIVFSFRQVLQLLAFLNASTIAFCN